MAEDEKNELVWKVFLSFFVILISVTAGLLGWLVLEVHRIDVDVATINTSRCTGAQCHDLQRHIDRVSDRVDKIPQEIPPPHFRQEVTSIGQRLAVVEKFCEGKGS